MNSLSLLADEPEETDVSCESQNSGKQKLAESLRGVQLSNVFRYSRSGRVTGRAGNT